ncbi:hypothetical protein IE077_001967 [Cardiosporidium cionae]|uniref:14-3-3 domain-containing protein n=1 Tax=Cardiosporidium cionae TaxID=476202 RepID=A0ABQ7JBX1_9APIC|nr:hypothetical protein IE077_001967 [Cardiosporidium cionae]|eukprot:KAF8821484.1 hypothetical protein IE077_001967 [Cardiosporidium cionae]
MENQTELLVQEENAELEAEVVEFAETLVAPHPKAIPQAFLGWPPAPEEYGETKNNCEFLCYMLKLTEACKRPADSMDCAALLASALAARTGDPTDESVHCMSNGFRPQLSALLQEKLKIIFCSRNDITQQAVNHCQNVVKLLNEELIPSAKTTGRLTLYLKLKADYYRHISDFVEGVTRHRLVKWADKTYEEAANCGNSIPACSSVRLGVAFNWCNLIHDYIGEREAALRVAECSYKEAVKHIEKVKDSEFREFQDIMIALNYKIKEWRQEVHGSSAFA